MSRPSSREVKSRPGSREGVYSRPQSRESSRYSIDRPLSRSSSSRALLARNNGRVREAMRVVREEAGLARRTGVEVSDVASCRDALQTLSSSIEQSRDYLDWICESGCLENVFIFLVPVCDYELLCLSMNLFRQSMLLHRKKEFSFSQSETLSCDPGYQSLFGITFRGLERLLPFIDNSATALVRLARIEEQAMMLLEVALTGNLGNQEAALSLGYMLRLTEILKSQTFVRVKCLALKCLATLQSANAMEYMLQHDTFRVLLDCFRSANAPLKIEASKVFISVAAFSTANSHMEELGLTPILVHSIHEENNEVRCAVLRALTALLMAGQRGAEAIIAQGLNWKLDPTANVAWSEQLTQSKIAIRRMQLISCSLEHVSLAFACADAETSVQAAELLCNLLALAMLEPQLKILCFGNTDANQSLENTTCSQTNPVCAESERSVFDAVVAHFLLKKESLALSIVHFVSNPMFSFQKAGLSLCESLMVASSFISNLKERKEFTEIVGRYSISWALCALMARTDVSMVILERAASCLTQASLSSPISRTVWLLPAIREIFERIGFNAKTDPLQIQELRSDGVCDLLPTTFCMEGIVLYCTRNIERSELSYRIRLELSLWLQGFIRGNSAARVFLSGGDYVKTLLGCIMGDSRKFPVRLKCALLNLIADLCSNRSYGISNAIWCDIECQMSLMLSTFAPVHKLISKLVLTEQTQPESKLTNLICSCCNLILNILIRNTKTTIIAVRAGVFTTALNLLESELMPCQVQAMTMVEILCSNAPSMAKLALKVGSQRECSWRSSERAVEGFRQEKDAPVAPMPDFVAALLRIADQTRPLQNVPTVEAAAGSTERRLAPDLLNSRVHDSDELRGLVPLALQSLRALLALCKNQILPKYLQLTERIASSISFHLQQLDPTLQSVAAWALLANCSSDGKQFISLETRKNIGQFSKDTMDHCPLLLANALRGYSLLSYFGNVHCADAINSGTDNKTISPNLGGEKFLDQEMMFLIGLMQIADDDSEEFIIEAVRLLCEGEKHRREAFHNLGGFWAVLGLMDAFPHSCLCEVGARSIYNLISTDYAVGSDSDEEELHGWSVRTIESFEIFVNTAVQVVLKLINSSKTPKELSAFSEALGALCTIPKTSLIQIKDVIDCLTRGLTSESSIVISCVAKALASILAFWRESWVRDKVKATGAIPCMVSLLSCPESSVQRGILCALKELSTSPKIKKLVTHNRAIEHVVRLMQCTSCDVVRSEAADFLCDLIQTSANVKQLLEFEGIKCLLTCLEGSSPQVVVSTARCIQNLMARKDSHGSTCWSLIQASFRSYHGLLRLKRILKLHSTISVVQACIKTVQVLCGQKHLYEDVSSLDFVPDIMEFASASYNIPIQGSAVVCLSTMLSQGFLLPMEIRAMLCDKITFLYSLTDLEKSNYFCQCVQQLANQADIRRFILNKGYFPLIFKTLQADGRCFRISAAGALEAWCGADPAMVASWSKKYGLKPLFELFVSGNDHGSEQAARTFAELAKSESAIRSLQREIPNVKPEGFQVFCQVMNRAPSNSLKLSCTEILRQIARFERWRSDISRLALTSFVEMLHSDDPEIVFSGCSSLAVLAGDENRNSDLAKSGVCPILCSLLQEFSVDIRCEACIVIRRIAATDLCKTILLKFDALGLLMHLLRLDSSRLVLSAAGAVEVLLSSYGCQEEFLKQKGLQIVEQLLDVDNASIRCKAACLLTALARNVQSKDAVFHEDSLVKKIANTIYSDDDNVVKVHCEMVAVLAGNASAVNFSSKSQLVAEGIVGALSSALARDSISTRASAVKALSRFKISDVRIHLADSQLLPVLIELISSSHTEHVVAGTRAITNFSRSDQPIRRAAIESGIIHLLARCINSPSDERKVCSPAEHCKVRSCSADALTSIVECTACRRGYEGLQSSILEIQGICLDFPCIVTVLPCPNRNTCLTCAERIRDSNVVDGILSCVRSADCRLQASAALALASCAVGAPLMGSCEFSKQVAQQCLTGDILDSLGRMLRNQALQGNGESVRLGACRAITSLCIHENLRTECCTRGFLKPLAGLLHGSTCGRLKSAAAFALARLSCSELYFHWNSQTLRSHWETPDEIKFSTDVFGLRRELPDDEVAYDPGRAGYWVRGIFKPLEVVPYRELVTATFEVKSGMHQGITKLKADNEIVTSSVEGLIEDFTDIFMSELYDDLVRASAAEALSILAQHRKHRNYIVSHNCVAKIVDLLRSSSVDCSEQAARTLSVLLTEATARDIAGKAGAAQILCDILNNKQSSEGLLQSSMLALAKLCYGASNQILALNIGAVMPLVEFLGDSKQSNWFCAVEAMCAISANEHNKKAIGIAGAVSAFVFKVDASVPLPVLVRILATLSNLISEPINCNQAVESGLMVRLINLGRSDNSLLLAYVVILVKNLFHADKWKMRFVDCGLIPFVISICSRLELQKIDSRTGQPDTLKVNLAHILLDLANYEVFKQSLVDEGAISALRVLMNATEVEARTMACETLSLLGTKDTWKIAAREAGLIPLLAALVRNKAMQVRLEAASSIRVLASNAENKSLLVSAGCLHGLRDMLEIDNRESKLRASSAIQILSRQQGNGVALAASGAIRPLVKLIASSDLEIQSNVTLALHSLARNQWRDTRSEIAECGAIANLATALECSSSDHLSLNLVRCCNDLARNTQLDSGAARRAKSQVVIDNRMGLVPADNVTRSNRAEMQNKGVGRQLANLVLVSTSRDLCATSQSCIAHLDGAIDLG